MRSKALDRLADALVMAAVTVRRKRQEPERMGKALEELRQLLDDARWPRRQTIKEAFA